MESTEQLFVIILSFCAYFLASFTHNEQFKIRYFFRRFLKFLHFKSDTKFSLHYRKKVELLARQLYTSLKIFCLGSSTQICWILWFSYGGAIFTLNCWFLWFPYGGAIFTCYSYNGFEIELELSQNDGTNKRTTRKINEQQTDGSKQWQKRKQWKEEINTSK